MHVLQCPRCEVRLPSAAELKDHLATDHPDFAATASSSKMIYSALATAATTELKHPTVEVCAGPEVDYLREPADDEAPEAFKIA